MRKRSTQRFRLGPIVRGTLDKLKLRVLKKRMRVQATHIDKSMKHLRGSHEWARRQVRMLKAFERESFARDFFESPFDRYRKEGAA